MDFQKVYNFLLCKKGVKVILPLLNEPQRRRRMLKLQGLESIQSNNLIFFVNLFKKVRNKVFIYVKMIGRMKILLVFFKYLCIHL